MVVFLGGACQLLIVRLDPRVLQNSSLAQFMQWLVLRPAFLSRNRLLVHLKPRFDLFRLFPTQGVLF